MHTRFSIHVLAHCLGRTAALGVDGEEGGAAAQQRTSYSEESAFGDLD